MNVNHVLLGLHLRARQEKSARDLPESCNWKSESAFKYFYSKDAISGDGNSKNLKNTTPF